MKLSLASLWLAACAADFLYSEDGNLSYAYYRQKNYNKSTPLAARTATGATIPAWTRTWNQTFSIYDSPDVVHVTRFDVSAKELTHLGGSGAFLKLTNGAAYFFTTATNATLKDVTATDSTFHFGAEHKINNNKNDTIGYNSVAWVSEGSCLALSVTPPPSSSSSSSSSPPPSASTVSILVVSSGALSPEFVTDRAGCTASSVLIGSEQLHNNPVDYIAVGECASPLNGHGIAPDYDDLDAPIGPLAMHYHTRGAVYYISAGTSVYDKGVPALEAGEMRFVQSGYYYGPETISTGAYVTSLHEPDPSARHISGTFANRTQFDDDEEKATCAFACYDQPKAGTTTLKCVHP